MDGERIVSAGDAIAVAFIVEPDGTITRYKYGAAEAVKEWAHESRIYWRASGFGDMADALAIIESDEWDIEDLNNIIHNCNYIDAFIKKHNIKLSDLTQTGCV